MTRSLKCSVLASVVSIAALGALAAPALATITTTRTSSTIATAIVADTSTISSSSFQEIAPTGGLGEEPNAVSDSVLGGFATNGSNYGILTTGDATLADDANGSDSDGVGLGGDNGGVVRGDNDFDVTVLQVNLNVPANVNCMTVDFRFLSEEYPEFVGGSVNDAFVAELDTSNWTTDSATAEVTAPNNFAFDQNGNPITVNAAGAATMTAGDAIGTTYDGATPLLAASTPVSSGAHSLYLSIFDQGDDIYDSAVFLDNVRFSNRPAGTCVTGATSGEVLAVNKNGTGTGSVTSSPAGIDCGLTCTKSFTKNTVVTLTPTASAGSSFTGWSGDCSGTGACTVTMDQAHSVTATFDAVPVVPPPSFTLTVGKNGTGSGTVTSSPGAISCGATCSQSYTQGTVVTLTPTPTAGSTFAGWSGDCTGTGACTVTMSQARSVTATFNLVPPVVGIPPSVPASGLFCGVQHRGKCNGIKVKTTLPGPGNAVWQFGAYNPNPGNSSARAAAVKLLALGQVKRSITKAGTVTIVFKLKAGARTRRLYRQAVKRKLTRLRIKVIFTTPSGQRLVKTKNIKLKLNR
jgi:Divergent InlB B-repeat domain